MKFARSPEILRNFSCRFSLNWVAKVLHPPTGIRFSATICEMSTHQVEGNRDLDIATCPANHPETPQPLQSRFLNRGSFPKLADFTKPDARQYRRFSQGFR
jgi:hypothetical protein